MDERLEMRQLENGFLKEYCAFHSNATEVPSIFSLWGGICCISTVLGRGCWVNMGHFKIHPNLYIVLVAGSARCHKSTAIGMANKVLLSVDPPVNLLSQKGTPEALIQSLTESASEFEGSVITERSEGLALVTELSTLIDRNSFQNGMISLLTDLWDCPKKFEYRTRGRGKETLWNCCLSIFSASTAQWIKEAIPIVAIGGGFTSRVMFVYQERPERLVALPEVDKDAIEVEAKIHHDLNCINRLHGEFRLSPQARLFFIKRYTDFHETTEMFEDKHLSGYAGRRSTIMLKLGMVVSASERDTRVIHEGDLKIAEKILENVEKTLPRVMQAITSETVGDICEEVLRFLKQKKLVKRSLLVTKFSNRLTSKELGIILDTLLEMKVIVQEGSFEHPMIVYTGK